MATNSPSINALENLVRAADQVMENRVPEHPRITSMRLAKEIASAMAELLGRIDANLSAGISQEAMERYPLLTSITWVPPSNEEVTVGAVGASFPFSTLVGPRFRIIVIPELVTS